MTAVGSDGAPNVATVAERLTVVRRRIVAAGGDPDRIRVVAVTKGFGAAAAEAAILAGLDTLGENYADELVDKAEALGAWTPAGVASGQSASWRWHFLGAIQRNKLRRLAAHVTCYEGVDRVAEAEAIARLAPGAEVLVEVDTTGTAGRGGVPVDEVGPLVRELAPLDVEVRGLMTVAPIGGGEPARAAFATVARLAADLGLPEVSMGMSDDLELAVAAGATIVRVGRALFGPRLGPG